MHALARGMFHVMDKVFGSEWGTPEFVRSLVDKNGRTAAHAACHVGCLQGLQAIHAICGDDILHVQDGTGAVPLCCSLSASQPLEITHALFAYICPRMDKLVFLEQIRNIPVVSKFMSCVSNPDFVTMLHSHIGNVGFLYYSPANVVSLIGLFIRYGNDMALRILWPLMGDCMFTNMCEPGYNFVQVAIRDNKLFMLDLAAQLGRKRLLKGLNFAGDQNVAHFAATCGGIEAFTLLLEVGLKQLFLQHDSLFQTPYDIALSRNDEEVAAWFIAKGLAIPGNCSPATASPSGAVRARLLVKLEKKRRSEKKSEVHVERPQVGISMYVCVCLCAYV